MPKYNLCPFPLLVEYFSLSKETNQLVKFYALIDFTLSKDINLLSSVPKSCRNLLSLKLFLLLLVD